MTLAMRRALALPFVVLVCQHCSGTPPMPKGPPPEYEETPMAHPATTTPPPNPAAPVLAPPMDDPPPPPPPPPPSDAGHPMDAGRSR